MKQGNEEFARRLRMLRTAAKLSQAELAQKAGVDPGSVSGWETGEYMPSLGATVRLADARLQGGATRRVHVIRMRDFTAEGEAAPPVSVTVRCEPGDADGIERTFLGALLRSRGWHCSFETEDVEEAT